MGCADTPKGTAVGAALFCFVAEVVGCCAELLGGHATEVGGGLGALFVGGAVDCGVEPPHDGGGPPGPPGGTLGGAIGFFFFDKFKCLISVRAARVCFLTISEAAFVALATQARLAKSIVKFACLISFFDCAGNSSG